MRTSLLRSLAAAALMALPCCYANAAVNIPIVNGSFEADVTTSATYFPPALVTGWQVIAANANPGAGTGGVWNVTDNPSLGNSFDYWNVDAPEGDNAGWLTIGPESNTGMSAFSQVVNGVGFAANTTYTLSGFVGSPIGFPSTYSVGFWANGVEVASSAFAATVQGEFADFSFSFITGAIVPLGDIEIRLIAGDAQVAFDDISLTATPEPATLVTWSVLGLAGFAGVWYKRRNA